jgi:hypothetical protein
MLASKKHPRAENPAGPVKKLRASMCGGGASPEDEAAGTDNEFEEIQKKALPCGPVTGPVTGPQPSFVRGGKKRERESMASVLLHFYVRVTMTSFGFIF